MRHRAAIGFDIGGTKVLCGLIDETGQIMDKERYPLSKDQLSLIAEKCCNYIARIQREFQSDVEIFGVGVAARGYVDHINNRIVKSSLFNDTADTDISAIIMDMAKMTVRMDNDVHAATLAELMYGVGKEENCFTYINVGTGLACGVIEQGKLLRGRNNISGEIGGFISRNIDGDICSLEELASGKGISTEAERLLSAGMLSSLKKAYDSSGIVSALDVFEAFSSGDSLAKKVITNASYALALAIVNMDYLLNSGLYVFGGGIINQPIFMEMLRQSVDSLTDSQSTYIKLKKSELGVDDVGLLGAASLIFAKQ